MKRATSVLLSLLCVFAFAIASACAEDVDVKQGPVYDLRASLLTEIRQAAKDGVGISSYMAAFSAIEADVTADTPADKIQPRVEKLRATLKDQLARAKATRSLDVDENFKSTGDTRFTNGYCVALEKYLMSKLTPMPELKGTVNLKVHAGPGAKLSAITLDKEFNKDIPEATQKKVLLKCKAITGIPEPPFPLDFSLAVSNTADEFQVTRDINFGTYMADLQRRIKRAWFPPKGNESRRVVVTFTIWRDGRMAQPKLFQSSGVTIADNAALAAVQNAAPFRPLPDGSPHNVDVRFTIDYNVFTGKK